MTAVLNIYGDISEDQFFDTDVTPASVKEFISDLKANEPLDVHINSYGGVVSAGLTIYNTIKAHKGHTRVFIDGFACSIASVIAFCGDELIMPDNAIMMIHLPYVGIIGNRNDLQKEIKTLETIERSMMTVYSENLKRPSDRSKVEKMLEDETWLLADEMNEYFNVTVTTEKETAKASVGILNRFKVTDKETVQKKFVAAQKRFQKDERLMVKETKNNLLDRFKREKSGVLSKFKK